MTSIVIGLFFTWAYSAFHPSLGHKGSNDSDMFCPVPLGLSIWGLSSSMGDQENNWYLGSICSDFEGLKIETNETKEFWANYSKLRTGKMHQLLRVWLVCSWTKIDIGFKAENIVDDICFYSLSLYNNITLTSALAPAWRWVNILVIKLHTNRKRQWTN